MRVRRARGREKKIEIEMEKERRKRIRHSTHNIYIYIVQQYKVRRRWHRRTDGNNPLFGLQLMDRVQRTYAR